MSKRVGVAVGILAAVLMAGPVAVFARGGGHGGGGGHSGGGGGHFGGGGHAAAPHFGGGAHFSGGARYGGGAHFAAAGHSYGGYGHYAAGGHSYGGYGHYAGGGYHGGYGDGYHGTAAYGGRGYAGGYRGGYGGYRGGYGGGYHTYSTGAFWRGGYWHGGFWPAAYYGLGYSWFLASLPLAYATYWYDSIPYYYANDVYYTWSPEYDGYVATDPPPAADASGSAVAPDAPVAAEAPPANAQAYPADAQTYPATGYPASGQGDPNAAAPPAPQAGAGDTSYDQPSHPNRIFMYPKNGQSAAQQRTDKLACEKWASDQVGLGSNGPDYQRAMVACIEGRGYSAN